MTRLLKKGCGFISGDLLCGVCRFSVSARVLSRLMTCMRGDLEMVGCFYAQKIKCLVTGNKHTVMIM